MRSIKSLFRSVPTLQYIDSNTLQDIVQYMKYYRAILCNRLYTIVRSGSNNFHFIFYFHPKVMIT